MELRTVRFDQAKKLKDLGFPQRIYDYLYLDGELTSKEEYDEMDCGGPFSVELSESECLSAPSLELVAKFFRQEKQLFIHIDYDFHDNKKPYKCELCKFNGMTCHVGWFNNYDEALSSAIDKCIHIIKEY